MFSPSLNDSLNAHNIVCWANVEFAVALIVSKADLLIPSYIVD